MIALKLHGKSSEKTKVRVWSASFAAPLVVLSCVIMLFWRSFLPGNSISKLNSLPRMDRLFGLDVSEPYFPITFDSSALLLHAPNAIFIEACAKMNSIPLWNPLNGLGEPFVGNIQAMLFSPLHFLFPASNPYLYNLGIVSYIAVGALGVYALCRLMNISQWASALAGLSYALCPHILEAIELSGQLFLYPWIVAGFVFIEKKQKIGAAITFGALLAVALLSMHPETFFVAVLTGVAVGFSSALARSEKRWKSSLAYSRLVSIVAAISIIFSLPVIVPFLELWQNSVLYKDNHNPSLFYPWHEYILGSFLPYQECASKPFPSPYLGLVSAILIPFGLIRAGLQNKPLIAIMAVLFILATWMAPFDAIVSKPPLSHVLSVYYVPSLVLLTALIAGFGLDGILTSKNRAHRWIVALAGLTVLLATIPVFGNLTSKIKESQTLDPHFLLSLIPVLSVLAVSSLVLLATRGRVAAFLFLILLNTATLGLSVTTELPVSKPFSYPRTEETEFLKNQNGRFLATGDRLIIPNVNLAYGLQDVRSLQVMHPGRYMRFIEAAGANHFLNGLFFEYPDQFDHLIDLASVKYLATVSAVGSADERKLASMLSAESSPGRITTGLRLKACHLDYDPNGSHVLMSAKWEVHQSSEQSQLQYKITDEHGKSIWSSNWMLLGNGLDKKTHINEHDLVLPVPLKLTDRFTVSVACRKASGRIIKPDGMTLKLDGVDVVLGTFPIVAPNTQEMNSRRFRIAMETDSGIRIYENRKALPEAFLVSKVIPAISEEDSFQKIVSGTFDPRKEVVIETDKPEELPARTAGAGDKYRSVSCKWINPNEALIRTDAESPSMLVFSQTYYPGWEATVDGRPASILRANYLFQSIIVEPGKHEIRFKYNPQSFFIPLAIACATATGLLLFALVHVFRNLKKRSADLPSS